MAAPPPPPPPAAPVVIQPAVVTPQWKVERDAIEQLVKQTTCIDGSSPPLTRAWLREVDLTVPLVAGFVMPGPQIVIATRTVTGPMRIDVERWLLDFTAANGVGRNQIPWANLRDYITATYLSANEPETLRSEVERLSQSALEDIPAYARRARGVVEAAFPQAQRVLEQDRIAVASFIKGIASHELARYVLERDPADLGQAINQALQRSAFEDCSAHLGIKKEPEGKVSGVYQPSKNIEQQYEKLSKQLEQLTTKMTKIELWSKQGKNYGKSLKQNGCFYCGKRGHFKRECRIRVSDMAKGGDGNTRPQAAPISGN